MASNIAVIFVLYLMPVFTQEYVSTGISLSGECNKLINSGFDYPKAEPQQEAIPPLTAAELEEYYAKQAEEAALNGSNGNYSTAQNMVSGTMLVFTSLLSAGSGTVVDSVALSGIGYMISTPINITMHWCNPNLSQSQKELMTAYEFGVAGGGMLLSYGLAYGVANCWNVTGWAAIGISVVGAFVYGVATWDLGNHIISWTEDDQGGVYAGTP